MLKRAVSLIALIALLIGTFAAIPTQADDLSPQAAIDLTLLHNNDGESSLGTSTNTIGDDDNEQDLPIGGIAAFKTVFDNQVTDAQNAGNAVLGVYAGDAFLASASLRCSDPFTGGFDDPVLDAVAQREIAYDAHILGNHEFDFNPDFLERFIRSFDDGGGLEQPFLSANLDFSNEDGFTGAAGRSELTDDDGRITGPVADGKVVGKSAIITKGGEDFGIVGVTTPLLPNISTPRDVTVTSTDIASTAADVQEEIDWLQGQGVNKIILVSHLQSLDNDIELIQQLSGVDVAVGGGGDELLLNKTAPAPELDEQYLPGTRSRDIDGAGDYPTEVEDKDGNTVWLVTGPGSYNYVGRLDVSFDAAGNVTGYNESTSYLRRVIPSSDVATDNGFTDAVAPDTNLQTNIIEGELEPCLDGLAEDFVGQTEVALDVSRNGVRGGETNGGNLIADSFVYIYDEEADNVDPRTTSNPVVAIQNGGGIRQNAPTGDTLEVGPISLLDTINVLPFDNRITLIEDVTPADLKAIFENSANALVGDDEDTGSGAYLQISGLRVRYDLAQPQGSRVIGLTLNSTLPDDTTDERAIVEDGEVVDGAPNVGIVTNSFTASGGDNYQTLSDIPDSRKVRLEDENGDPLLYQQALELYLGSFPIEDTIETQQDTLPTIRDDDPRYQPGVNSRAVFLEDLFLPVIATS